MTKSRDISPKGREVFLMIAFAAIVAGGIVTVLIPALNQDNEREAETQSTRPRAPTPTKAQNAPSKAP